MASNYTTNYQLNQWEAGDQVLRTEFNQDNQKIDTALKNHDDEITGLEAAVVLKGNCQIAYGSYQGSGQSGSEHPTSLTFANKPVLVLIQEEVNTDDRDLKLRMVRGSQWAVGMDENYTWEITVSWTEHGVQWYSDHSAGTQFNASGVTYHYAAFLAVMARIEEKVLDLRCRIQSGTL